ncbi:exonuclease VII large subunit [Actimicrobium sp. GrIS 1.19]|nr:exonuclease VII large subunit [Actimicrobium sp. GrIS 1.19]
MHLQLEQRQLAWHQQQERLEQQQDQLASLRQRLEQQELVLERRLQELVQEQRLLLFCRKQQEPEPTGRRSTEFFSWIFLQGKQIYKNCAMNNYR